MAAPPAWVLIAAGDVLEGKPATEVLLSTMAGRDRSNSDKPFDFAFAERFDTGGSPTQIVLTRRGDSLPPTNRSIRWVPDDASRLEWEAEVWNSDGATTGRLDLIIRVPQAGGTISSAISILAGDTSATKKTTTSILQFSAVNIQPAEIEIEIQLARLTGSGNVRAKARGITSRTYQD